MMNNTITHPAPEYILQMRGKRVMKYRGYTYYTTLKHGYKLCWKCSTQSNCKAIVYTLGNKIYGRKGQHEH
uniref:SFRICE_004213 n=1 Tax=Spodoptera frugiperda TaxID=7108 RepID=A0A2H1VI99_SPOFR